MTVNTHQLKKGVCYGNIRKSQIPDRMELRNRDRTLADLKRRGHIDAKALDHQFFIEERLACFSVKVGDEVIVIRPKHRTRKRMRFWNDSHRPRGRK